MREKTRALIEKLDQKHWLSDEELLTLVKAGPAGTAAAEAEESKTEAEESKAAAALLADLWQPGLCPGPHRNDQLLQERLLLLRHPKKQPGLRPVPAHRRTDPDVLPGRI